MSKSGGMAATPAYWLVLGAVSLWVLAAFLTPSPRHSGLNLYPEIQFPDLVKGTAHRPFVYRTLLPTTVRLLTAATPGSWREQVDRWTRVRPPLRRMFRILGWGERETTQYYFAALLMWISYLGFAHFTVLLTCRQLGWRASIPWRIVLGSAALLLLPACFKYSSFPYDPPQLFLFTLALFLVSEGRFRGFFLVFLLCCLNKETAALLIPIHAAVRRGREPVPVTAYRTALMAVGFMVIKGGLTWVFRDNPGPIMEFHLRDHNLGWLLGGWSAAEVAAIVVIPALVAFRWKRKPAFLRTAFLGTLPLLVLIALFYGFIDEWRIYYEAYAVVFALSVATLRSVAGRDIPT